MHFVILHVYKFIQLSLSVYPLDYKILHTVKTLEVSNLLYDVDICLPQGILKRVYNLPRVYATTIHSVDGVFPE